MRKAFPLPAPQQLKDIVASQKDIQHFLLTLTLTLIPNPNHSQRRHNF